MMTTISRSARVSLKPIEVPKALQEGEKFIKWDEDSGTGLPVTLRVDPKGFFLYWTDQNMEVEMLDIATIRDVRTGGHAKVPKDPKIRNVVLIGSQGSLEEKTVTVCHGADFVNVMFINFCCTRREIAQLWTEGLFALAYNLSQLNNPTIKFLEKLHTKIALKADKSGKILVKNIVKLLAQNKEDKKRVEKALSESGLPTGKNDTISQCKFQFVDFFEFYKNLTQRTEVQKIFNTLTDSKPHLSANQLVDFLNEIQRDPRLNEILHPYADLQRAKDLIKAYEHNKYHQQRSQLTFDGFLRFIMSEDNPIVAPSKMDLCDDMEQPLAHYFINSSHNTYLTGHQITGKSSVEIYRQSLLAGCRCVELDFWNGRTDEPVIVHGYTFVPEISAKEVLEAIAESAFKTSDYPVILSFENHCNPRQQAKIANYCREIFGDMLLDKPLDSHQLEPGGELPPPSMLRNKIIIKNKKKHHHHHKKDDSVASEESEPRPEIPQGNGDVTAATLTRQGSSDSSDSESSSGEEEAGGVDSAVGEDARETHAGAEISALVNYVQPVHFSSFENSEKKNRFYEMSSFDEKQATTLLKERPIEFVNYNKHQLSRVYPAGTRFDSSNFMPQVFWNAGCQLVALNYQTLDLAMQLNLGTYEYNRRCGYLLKPEFMRRKDRRLDPFAESTVDGIIAGTLSVTVLSGQLLTDKRCGTYVEVDMFGLPADTVRKKFRTRVAPNNGINPVYGEEPFVFKKVVLPELAMLRIAAHEESGRLLGHRVLPVLGLCPGYRSVNLRTELGLPLPASLLLLVVVKDYVPDRLSELAEALANPIKYQSELDKREHQLAKLTEDTDVPSDSLPSRPKRACDPPERDDARRTHAHPIRLDDAPDGSPSKDSMMETKKFIETESIPSPLPPNDADVKTNGTSDESLAETLETLLSMKVVREKQSELARKLDALRRKFDKEKKPPTSKFYVSNKLVKRLSSKNMSGEAPADEAGEFPALERQLRLKCHHAVYAALEKHVRNDQHLQMKALSDLLEAEKKEILNRLANSRKEDVKALAKKTNRDKDEINRIKREIHSQSVERGVAECCRLEQKYAARREQLARTHDRLLQLLLKHRDQVAVVGAGSDVGRIACLFLKQQKVIKFLAMYEESPESGVLGVATDIAHIDTSCVVAAFQGRMFLKDALHEADVVLICGGSYLPPPTCYMMDRDLFFRNVQHVRTATLAVAQFCPHAIVAVQTPPVDCNFALCAHTLKLSRVYDKRRVLGVNAVNAMRANQLFCNKYGGDPTKTNLPVVCGTGRCTRVPVFSVGKAVTGCGPVPDQDSLNCLSRLVREADDLICTVKSNNEQGHLSIGFSTARFVVNLMQGLFETTALIDSALVQQGDPEKCYGMKYCATPVKVGKKGISEYVVPALSPAEKELLVQARCDLEDMLNLGRCFAVGDEYYLHPCKYYPCIHPKCEVCQPCRKSAM